MKTIAEFSARFLEPVMRFADRDGVREGLAGMQVIPAAKGGVLLAATNGHVAIIARDPDGKMAGTSRATFLPERSLVEASVTHPDGRFLLTDSGLALIGSRRERAAGESELDACLTAGKARLIKGDPPDIAGAFPEEAALDPDRSPSFCINSEYVGLFSDSFSAMAGMERDGWEGVELRCEPPEEDRHHRKVLVMPITKTWRRQGSS
ncbi:hypothetical protein [Ectothiorhodospira mobilis]|uniref:hypothetical protein n=1 Tax=Ectothiorhodospira mobilis TaxID=195064 RepID=UPI0019087DC4|nr:hypothetical protein [Ectothiorhodospira mobilis]MBK1691116.1 hypothetical protein [Ectothiorhodospira mobilis]